MSELASLRGHRFAWLALLLATVMIGILLLLLWASLWPLQPCSHPSCARSRFTLALEVDALQEVAPIAFNFQTSEGPVSLQSILAGGGIDLAVTYDDLDLPYKAASGPLDRADLYQFVSAWRNRPSQGDVDARLYALFTPGLISDKGEPLFGIMFDHAGREAFAVAPRTTRRFFEANEAESIDTLQLRTFVHELLHALNRDHTDAATMSDGRLTLEAPTRCIARGKPREWQLVEPPLMALSPATIRFFQTASTRDVLPGKGNSPYQQRRASPAECEQARANVILAQAEPPWRVRMRQLKELFSISTAEAAESAEQSDEPVDVDVPALELALQAQSAAYPLGYPIAVRVTARNTGDVAVPVKGRLSPGYGMLLIEYRSIGESEWQTMQPLTWFEPTGETQALLPPGDSAEETIPIYFGEEGWTFPQPGEYEIRATLRLGEQSEDVVTEPLPIRVAAPQTDADRAALQPLLDVDGELDRDIGRLLNFGGRIGGAADITPLESVAALYGQTALGGAMRLTLLSHRLRPTIDPRTGERPPPDLSEARALLTDTCTDSGIAALTFDLLGQRADSLPAGFGDVIISPAAAWDGTTPDRAGVIATYSDAALSRWGPSLHFCSNESSLRNEVSREARRLGETLAEAKPTRVVVVGHGDRGGACRKNDALAMRRAEAVRAQLIAGGVPRARIQLVSLGERRPLDFSSSEEAQELNRRVEILVDGVAIEGEEPPTRVLPACPKRANLVQR